MSKRSFLNVRFLLKWGTLLSAAATIGSLALPSFNSITLKLGAAALVFSILWWVYPKGESS
jgi:hypothetical protein